MTRMPILCLGLVVGGLTAPTATWGNLLLNPGFEFPNLIPPDNQAPGADDWTTFNTAGVRTAEQHSGDQSLRLAPSAPTGTGDGIARQVFPAAQEETYSFAAWVLNPSSDPLTGTRVAEIRIQWLNAGNTLINQTTLQVADSATPQDQWTYVSLDDVVLPSNPNITQVRPSLFVRNNGGTGGGVVFWDDAIFVQGSIATGPKVLAQTPSNPADGNVICGSPISDISYKFDQPVVVAPGDISVTDGQALPVTFSLLQTSPQDYTIQLNTAIGIDTYTIVLADTIISTVNGEALDGDGDGTAGGNATFMLTHTNLGDFDMDGDQDMLDFAQFQMTFTGPLP